MSGHKNSQIGTFWENVNNFLPNNDRMHPKSSQLKGIAIYIGPRAGSRSLDEKNDPEVPKNRLVETLFLTTPPIDAGFSTRRSRKTGMLNNNKFVGRG